MTFWTENYQFIREVYDTRYQKMVEWMDNVEMAIQKVCASKVYTSAEFKREKDNFHSLCKNLERAETKKWLTETLETLMKERAADEQKEEHKKLKLIMERHKGMLPKIQDTLVKTECYWKCYSYGDDLIPIFEFIDDLRNRSVKELVCGSSEQTEEHIEKQDKVLNSLENKRKMVMDFIAKGEKLMQDPNCPKFLDGHVKKLREAWDDTNEKAQTRKKALADNLSSWETFENEKVENHKQLDLADAEFDNIKKIFDLKAGPTDYEMRMKTAANFRKGIEGLFDTVSGANDCLQQMLPDEKKQPMADEVGEIKTRMERLTKTDERLAFILDFNQRLAVFDKNVVELEDWLGEGRKRLDGIRNPTELLSPEDRVTKTMEVQEDINKKSEFCGKQETEKAEIFPKQGEKVSSDAKKFIERLKKVRDELNKLDAEIKAECAKFSEDVKYFAEFQTGIKAFDPWMKKAEQRIVDGLKQPKSLVEACEVLGDSKNFQEECEAKLKILEEAAASAQKMTTHDDSDEKVQGYKERWVKAHEISKEWVARMTTLVECWNKLDGNVGELSSWVNTKDSAAPEGKSEISIEKLETQLNTLKTMFAEKQKLVADLEAYGAGGGAPAAAEAAPAEAAAPAPEAEAAPADAAPAEETPAA
jgi:DNA repair ATPase RecN